jgi:hypothetical protein
MSRKPPRSRSLRLEPLEPRVLLSATRQFLPESLEGTPHLLLRPLLWDPDLLAEGEFDAPRVNFESLIGRLLPDWPGAAEAAAAETDATPKPDQIISPLLLEVADALDLADPLAAPLTAGADSPLVRVDAAGALQVYVHLDALSDDALSGLASAGLRVETSSAERAIVQGWVDPDDLSSLAALPGVQAVTPPDYAVVNAGSVTTAGDAILRADEVRADFAAWGIDGTGIKIGVISDGVDHYTYSQGTGDLPGTIHIDPGGPGNGDEGTAMLEIVHDLAPGAELYFSGFSASGSFTSLDMVDAINWLVAQGCDVIVDDLGFPLEPFFEDGPVAQAAAGAVSSGVVYVSSAGNYADTHYQADYLQGPASGAGFYHDFDPGAGVDDTFNFTIPVGGNVTAVLQWSDPYGASGNDYDLYLHRASNGQTLDQSIWGQDGNDDPYEYVQYTNTGLTDLDVYLKIDKYSGDPRELELYLFGYVDDLEYVTPNDSIWGHAAVESVISVGAIGAYDPGWDTIEYFSSQGPSTIYTDFATQTSVQRLSLDGCAIDGVHTAVGAAYWYDPFFGTSAAAPHAAAIAALVLDADGTLSPAEVSTIMNDTAVDLTAYGTGYDNASGFGRFDAVHAVYKAFTPDATDMTAATDLGVSDTDDITSDPTPTFTGSAPLGSFVRLYVDGTEYGSQQLGGAESVYAITAATIADGTSDVTVRFADSSSVPATDLSNESSPLSVTIDTVAPQLAATDPIVINAGTAFPGGRSQIRTVTWNFTEPVAVALGDLSLENRDTSSPVDISTRPLSTDGNAVTLELDRYGVDTSPQLFLDNGNYDLVLGSVTDVAGNALDADASGLPDAEVHFQFRKLTGDFDGNTVVNLADYVVWDSSYHQFVGTGEGETDAMFDLDANTYVNLADYVVWDQHYHNSIPILSEGWYSVDQPAALPGGTSLGSAALTRLAVDATAPADDGTPAPGAGDGDDPLAAAPDGWLAAAGPALVPLAAAHDAAAARIDHARAALLEPVLARVPLER